MKSTVFIDVPPHFSFRSTVYSHGWCDLAPFSIDAENWRLSYVFHDGTGRAVPAVISEEKRRVRVDLANSKIKPEKLLADTRHILRLDDDLSGFYSVIDGHERLHWAAPKGAGRMLRSPTVWEDLIKTICTTNCSWGLTKIMVANLVAKLGVRVTASAVSRGAASSSLKKRVNASLLPRAFPTPEAMASVDEKFYRTEIKAGYRSPYFVELAEKVAAGALDPQQWLVSDLPTPELKKEIKKVKGVGDYAAENLLKLVGRYDGLALDSWLRSQFYKLHNREKVCSDKKIERHYKKFGPWRGLVIWCEMTERYINL